MALRDGEDHQIQMCAGVEFRRTDQISHIFQNDEIQPLRSKLEKALAGHGRVEMAHAAGVELNDTRAGARYGVGVHVGVNVGLHHAYAERFLQQRDQTRQRRRFPGAGRGHEVD